VLRWLQGLGGNLLPREAISALIQQVQRKDMDGEAFDALVASRRMPSLGDAVRPSHMATLRRCWNADYCRPGVSVCSTPMNRSTASLSSMLLTSNERPGTGTFVKPGFESRFAPPPRRVEPPPREPQYEEEVLSELAQPDSPASSSKASQVRRPPNVPPLDLTFIHRNAGNRGEDPDELGRHEWNPPGRRTRSSAAAATSSVATPTPSVAAEEATQRVGFAFASPEDKQRIAEFYGYRDEGFATTMTGLRTDQVRPRLYVGNMADAAYWPLLKSLGITHIVNVAVEAQKAPPPYETQGIKYLLTPFYDTVDQAQSLSRQKFGSLRG
ncbi:unnamed protein product, partial [Polarella glacialis]